MARKRMIDPSIWIDDGMAELLPRQQLLYVGMISNADDEGRLKGNPTAIRLMLPGVYGEVDSDEIDTDVEAVLQNMQKLVRYFVDNRPYLVFRNYSTWQVIRKPQPSVLPAPPDNHSPTSDVPVPYQYGTGDEPVTPNRTEQNRKEQNRTEPRERARAAAVEFGITDEEFTRSLEIHPVDDETRLPGMVEDFVAWHREKGKQRKSPYRAWLSWLKKDREFRERDGPMPNGRSPTDGLLVSDTSAWLEREWEEARRHG